MSVIHVFSGQWSAHTYVYIAKLWRCWVTKRTGLQNGCENMLPRPAALPTRIVNESWPSIFFSGSHDEAIQTGIYELGVNLVAYVAKPLM